MQGALNLPLILFALAGLMVVGKLPLLIVGLVIAAGVALGALLFVLRWLAKRRDPAYSCTDSTLDHGSRQSGNGEHKDDA